MFTTRPELAGTLGMVASTHWIASQCGMAVLECGGNAFDAAVATGLVLQVVEPHLNGPAGEMALVAWDSREERPFVVSGQGPAPELATTSAFRDQGLDLIPGTGLLPACVPGQFGAWMLLLRDYGTLPLREVLDYAIGYAEHGFPVAPRLASAIETVADRFNEHWPTSAATWLIRGTVPQAGQLIANHGLAETYRRLLTEAETAGNDREAQIESARAAFYAGFVAEAINTFAEKTPVMDGTSEPHRGLLRYEDLTAWRATTDEPVSFDYHGYTVLKAGPWTQGPVLLQQLALLAGFDLDSYGPESAELVHTVTECAKLAFADREVYYGDPHFSDVPVECLLSQSYNDERRRLVQDTADIGGLRPGAIPDRPAPRLPRVPRVKSASAPCGGDGEPHHPAERSNAWRHLTPRCRRPLRKHGQRHAERGLAAKLTRCT